MMPFVMEPVGKMMKIQWNQLVVWIRTVMKELDGVTENDQEKMKTRERLMKMLLCLRYLGGVYRMTLGLQRES